MLAMVTANGTKFIQDFMLVSAASMSVTMADLFKVFALRLIDHISMSPFGNIEYESTTPVIPFYLPVFGNI
jgi:hypothetical protein